MQAPRPPSKPFPASLRSWTFPANPLSPIAVSRKPTPCTRFDETSLGEFWAKNRALGRPMSPHLTIYKFLLTSMLSISHRWDDTEVMLEP